MTKNSFAAEVTFKKIIDNTFTTRSTHVYVIKMRKSFKF